MLAKRLRGATSETASAVQVSLEHNDTGVLGLVLWLDVDSDHSITVDVRFQRRLDPVADGMSLRDPHIAGDDQVKVDEGHAPGMARANIVSFERTLRMLADQVLDASDDLGGGRLIHKATRRLGLGASSVTAEDALPGHCREQRRIGHLPYLMLTI